MFCNEKVTIAQFAICRFREREIHDLQQPGERESCSRSWESLLTSHHGQEEKTFLLLVCRHCKSLVAFGHPSLCCLDRPCSTGHFLTLIWGLASVTDLTCPGPPAQGHLHGCGECWFGGDKNCGILEEIYSASLLQGS